MNRINVSRKFALCVARLSITAATVLALLGSAGAGVASASSTYNFVICGPAQAPGSMGGAAGYGFTSSNYCNTPSSGVVSGTTTSSVQGGAGYNPIWWTAPADEYFGTFSWNSLSAVADAPSPGGQNVPGEVEFEASNGSGWFPNATGANNCSSGPNWTYLDGQANTTDCSVGLGRGSENLYSSSYGNATTFWMRDEYDSGVHPGTEDFSVTNPVLSVVDPNTTAALSSSGGLWSDLGSTTKWYNGSTLNALSQTATASDPGGACFLQPTLTATTGSESAAAEAEGGSALVASGGAAQSTYASGYDSTGGNGAVSGGGFSNQSPCGGTTNTLTLGNWDTVPSGTYYLNVAAQNPAQYASGEGSNSDFTWLYGSSATTGEQINVDNSTPTVTINSTASQTSTYSSVSSVPALTVSASDTGGSGVSNIVCTDSLTQATYTVTSSSGTIPAANLGNGTNNWTCNATNGAGTQSSSAATFTIILNTTAGGSTYDAELCTSAGQNTSLMSYLGFQADGGTGAGSDDAVNINQYDPSQSINWLWPQSEWTGTPTQAASLSYASGIGYQYAGCSASSQTINSDSISTTVPADSVYFGANWGLWNENVTAPSGGGQAYNAAGSVAIGVAPLPGNLSVSSVGATSRSLAAYSTAGVSGVTMQNQAMTGGNTPVWDATGTVTNNWGANGAVGLTLTKPYVVIHDPNAQPTITTTGSLWSDLGSSSTWYSGATLNSDAASSTYSANDPGSVCLLHASFVDASGNNPSTSPTKTGNINGTANLDSTGDYESAQPCNTSTSGTIGGFDAVPSGSYYLNVSAQNPAEYAQGQSANSDFAWLYGSSATSGDQVNVDNTVPTATWASTSSSWTTHTSETLQITVGPSGLGSVTCTNNGTPDTATPQSGNPSSGAGTYDYKVATSTQGTNAPSCSVANGDTDPLTAQTAAQTYQVDSAAPTVSFTGTASQTNWYSASSAVPTLGTAATVGQSGLASYACSGDGIGNQTFGATAGGQLDLSSANQGTGTITCTVTSVVGTTATATFSLNIDSTVPTVAWGTTEDESTWYPSAASVPAIGVNGSTTGASGVDHITCSGDGLTGNVKLNGSSGTPDTSQLPNGSDTITCVAVSGAGVSSSTISRTIQVDNSTPAIALTGTDQNTWYSGDQTVTADASADSNPSGIQSVSCSVDGGTATVTSGATAAQAVSGDGSHTVTCRPLSGAGVAGPAESTTVKIDSQTPTVALAIVPAPATAPTGTVAVQVTASEANNVSGIASTSCSLDSQSATTVNGSHQTVLISTGGNHSLDCTGLTNAGVSSADATATYSVTTDPGMYSLQYGAVSTAWQSSAVSVPIQLAGATANNYSSLICAVNNGAPTTINGTSGDVTVTGSGNDKIDCYATANNGAETAAVEQMVHIDSQKPSGAWSIATNATGDIVTLTGSEQTPLSGIAAESCTVDNGATQSANAATLRINVVGNGHHQIACTITTGAGVTAAVNDGVTVSVPVTAPIANSTPDPGRWYQTAQSIVIGIPTTGPTVASVVCTQAGVSTTYPVVGATVNVPVAAPGGDVQCYDVDSTGAQSAPVTFPVHIDDQAPTGYFIQAGTTQATATITDGPDGSGVHTVTVQYQIDGGQWVTIPGSYDTTTGQITVTLPTALQQPGVSYALRALAVDYAGNSSVVNTMKDGSPANSTAPDPYAGAAVTGGLYVGTVPPGSQMRVVKITRVHKVVIKTIGTTRRRRTITVTRKRWVTAINRAKLANTLTASYGQPVSLTGTLTLADGQVAHQPVTIVQQAGKTIKRSTAYTNASGVFNVKLARGGTRTITYTVAGVSQTVTLREHGAASVRLRGNSLAVTVDGATGKVRYRVQRFAGGRWLAAGGWLHTNAHGRAEVALAAPVAATGATRLRIVISTQASWDYLNLKERV